MEEKIKALGWGYIPNFGWVHPDYRNDDGHLVFYDSVEDVVRVLGIEDDVAA